MNPDFRDLFAAFNAAEVRYLVVGAHAVMHYARPRFTKDLDVWVDPARENAPRTHAALQAFGAPLDRVTSADFSDPEAVFQIGVAPNRIDVLMGVTGLTFPEAWSRRVPSTYGDIAIHLLAREDLIRNKRATGRPQDLEDLRALDG
jgi:hypothetical protein